jgi:hypothetical protein
LMVCKRERERERVCVWFLDGMGWDCGWSEWLEKWRPGVTRQVRSAMGGSCRHASSYGRVNACPLAMLMLTLQSCRIAHETA